MAYWFSERIMQYFCREKLNIMKRSLFKNTEKFTTKKMKIIR